MRLEDEIKTKQFQSARHKLNVNLIYTYNWFINRSQRVFQSFGITIQQYNILRILRGQFPNTCSNQLIKERMLDKQPDVSRLIDRLTQKELVERKVCSDDRRKMDILITQTGLDLLIRIDPEIRQLEETTGPLSDAEVEQLNELLDRLRD
jgi:DNA-binding MarR family transcriptional regulator